MKSIFLILITLFPLLSFSQIKQVDLIKCEKVGYVTQGAYDIMNEKCSDGNYKFSFRDYEYAHITIGKSFEFKDIDGSYDKLFEAIINGFDNVKEDIAFELPNQYLIINYMSALGVKGASFVVKDKIGGLSGRSNYFSKNQIYRLFGRKKLK